jgi:hypothetical protein
MKSLSDLRDEDIREIDLALRDKESDQMSRTTVAQFLALHIDFSVEKALSDLIGELDSTGNINIHKLEIILFDLIKKRCNFKTILSKITSSKNGSKIPLT